MASLSFFGAARTVTGSRHLLDLGDAKILVDCGMFQGDREARARNAAPFPFDPADVDALVVTHAHMDHIGLIPRLIAGGFRGPIVATPATIGLARVSLPDSGRIQEEEASRRARHGGPNEPPLYTEAEAYAALERFEPLGYHTEADLPGGATLTFRPAGHILGSAYAQIGLPEGRVLLMGGDLGRFGTPVIRDPERVAHADYLVVESTYGDREHRKEPVLPKLRAILERAAEVGGAVLVPSFSIGRTQELLYYLRKLQDAGEMPRMPIFLDSPMAVTATELYRNAKEDQDDDMLVSVAEGRSELDPEGLQLVRDRATSKALNARPGAMVIIAGSGMATGGRIVHHLLQRLGRSETTVLFTGYQAEGSLGRRILEGENPVKMLGQEVAVAATVERLNALSAHADQGEILDWLRGFAEPPRTTFIVHGEPRANQGLADAIAAELGWRTVIPAFGETYSLE